MNPAAIMPEIEGRTMLDPHRLATFARLADSLPPGAMAEVGVYNGGTSRFLARLYPDRRLYAFDTFADMPLILEPFEEKHHQPGKFAPTPDTVEWLEQSPNIIVRQGIFPATVAGLHDERFALVHLDADLYATTREALDYFWPRLDGFLVIDDFRRQSCPGVSRALFETIPEWKLHAWEASHWLNQLVLRKEPL